MVRPQVSKTLFLSVPRDQNFSGHRPANKPIRTIHRRAGQLVDGPAHLKVEKSAMWARTQTKYKVKRQYYA